jgi:hypothetical protein
MVTYVSEKFAASTLRAFPTLKMEAADTSGKLVTFYHSPRLHIQGDRKFNIQPHEKFKPQIFPFLLSAVHNGPCAERMLVLIIAPLITTQ